MPRYFFNLMDGVSVDDDEGTDLANDGEAKREGIRFGGSLLRDFPDHVSWTVIVTGEDESIVVKLVFAVREEP